MDNPYIPHKQPQSNIELPMAELVELLRRRGFPISPDDYIELLKVVECFGEEVIPLSDSTSIVSDKLAHRICPLVATSEQEQKKFYLVYEEYKQVKQQQPVTTTGNGTANPVKKTFEFARKNKMVFLIVAIGLATLIIYMAWKASQPSPLSASFTVNHNTIAPGDTVLFDASVILAGRLHDSSEIKTAWNFGEGWTDSGRLVTTHHFTKEGEQMVQLKLLSPSINIEKELDSAIVTVCAGLADITIKPINESVRFGQHFGLTASYTNAKNITEKFWLLDNDTLSHTDSFTHKLDKTGYFTYQFVAVAGDHNSPCTQRANYSITVEDTAKQVLAGIQQAGTPLQPASQINPVWAILLLVPSIGALAGSFWLLYRRSHPKKVPLPHPPPVRPPYEIPFENNELRLVAPGQEMRKVTRLLRQKSEQELLEINIPKTIQSTIRSGGLDDLVQTPRLQSREYLVLIDRSNPANMQVALFDYLVNNWREENIPVDRFYYTNNFTFFFNEAYAAGLNLRQLADRYRHHTLIILGTAQELVYDAYPVIEKKLLEDLSEWENKAIVTPTCYEDWGAKEEILKKHFVLLPADAETLAELVPAIQERKLQQDAFLSSCKNLYSASPFLFKKTSGHLDYLDNDNDLYQWLCAICVYPKLRWEILIEAGQAILKNKTEKLSYAHLLKLCRITWIQKGAIPENIRLELLKQLAEENEIAMRKVLLRMLAVVDKNVFKAGAAFEEEKYIAQITNRFVIYSNAPEDNAGYKDSPAQFKQLWKNGKVLDIPFANYITGSGSGWSTPVKYSGQPVTIQQYFTEEVKATNRTTLKKIWPVQACALLLLVIYGIFQISNTKLSNSWLAGVLHLYTPDSSKNVELILSVNDHYCTAQPERDGLVVRLAINTVNYPLTFKEKVEAYPSPAPNSSMGVLGSTSHTFTAYIPFRELTNGTSLLNISWTTDTTSGEKMITQQLPPINNSTVIVNLPGCDTTAPIIPDPPIDSTSRPDSADSYTCGLTASSLPSSLNEIYSSRVSTFIKINPQAGIIYYAPVSKNEYSQYTISEICRAGNGTIRITTASKRNGTRMFFIRNARNASFELATCLIGGSSPQGNCESFIYMSLYYPPGADYIYIPVNGITHITSEDQKMNALQKTIDAGRAIESITYYINAYNTRTDVAGRVYDIRTWLPFGINNPEQTVDFPGTPFDRDYVAVKLKPALPNQVDPCSLTYLSLDEAKKDTSLNAVCRLNLSGQYLVSLPPEMGQLRSLKFLDIRNNQLMLEDSFTLKKLLPADCQILFSPQNPKSEWIFVLAVDVNRDYTPVRNGIKELQQIANRLAQDPQYRIKIVAYYRTTTDGQQAERRANGFKAYIVNTYSSKLNFADRIITEIAPISQQPRQQPSGTGPQSSPPFQSVPDNVYIFEWFEPKSK